MKRQTPGQRVFLVRLARGDGVKRPEKLEDFAAAINAAAGTRYDSSTLSRVENGDRKVTLEDCEAIAALDPLGRGPGWIGFGDEDRADNFVPDASRDRPISAAEVARAREARDATRASKTAPAKKSARKANGQKGA